MRIFLIVISFVNGLLYFAVYTYFDTIIGLMGSSLLSGGLQSFIKVLILLIAGFCIGLIPMLLLSPGMRRNRLDVKNLILVGIVPFILIILSPGPVNDFIATKIFSNNDSMKELLFYLFSRQPLWSLWLGFAIGTSVRISLKRREYRYAVSHTINEEGALKKDGNESN